MRFAVVAVCVGALGVAALSCLPVTPANLPPPLRALPESAQLLVLVVLPWVVLLIAAFLGATAVRGRADPARYRIVVAEGQLRFPLWSGAAKVVPVSGVVSIGVNAGGDHVVILTQGERYLLPWYVLPKGKTLQGLAAEVGAAVAGASSEAAG